MTARQILRATILATSLAALSLFFIFDGSELFTVQHFFNRLAEFREEVRLNSVYSSLVFFLVYVALAALSVPGAGPLSILSGAIFEFWWAAALSLLAATTGATLAFASSKVLFRNYSEMRFRKFISAAEEGMSNYGNWYLLMLRTFPIFPFAVTNLMMGLTSIEPRKFVLLSVIGMTPSTLIYVYFGRQLGFYQPNGNEFYVKLATAFGVLMLLPISIRAWFWTRRRRQLRKS